MMVFIIGGVVLVAVIVSVIASVAGAVAGVVSAVISHAVTPGTLAEPSAVIRDTILDAAVSSAAQAIKNISCLWQHIS